jgi:hypothetical protein
MATTVTTPAMAAESTPTEAVAAPAEAAATSAEAADAPTEAAAAAAEVGIIVRNGKRGHALRPGKAS